MPKFIGNRIAGTKHFEQENANAWDPDMRGYVRLTYSQARLLPPEQVACSLDTTDRGSRGSYAKRWYRWFALATDILACEQSTANMRTGARVALAAK